MNILRKSITGLLLLVSLSNNAQTANNRGLRYQFACTDYTQGMVFVISNTGKPVWYYPARAL